MSDLLIERGGGGGGPTSVLGGSDFISGDM